MTEDFSKGSLAVILVLALIISVLSTITVLNAIDDSRPVPVNEKPLTSGNLKLEIKQPVEAGPQQAAIMLQIKGDN